ncbi:hypothetical protein N7491_007880 [Penicillium cf. griseofulvum]|uniref:FAD/NAD(P)-binding domain-containing protein n=1 Tax=Penicillium cf. griseofulvum TaxID=2972120 RepID=A0A9W9J3S8_9EURO|nr:hypothetical protein N7472_009092 [Penicillium cf. griseofulvum]KAJ5427438.1 hypothetical protein N7491_007880 [Penicillium cf. griseofulvum]KAJ5431638.1 hypothetical protein N7445_008136 [Penicillium cf. griseofulvum]
MAKLHDVLIVGGGPAGLSTALGLARQLHSAVIFDSQIYRNDVSDSMHNVLTWDHRPPSELRAVARRELLTRYDTVQIQNTEIKEVRRTTQGTFEALDGTGEMWEGKILVLATGVRDVPPDITGYASAWGKGIFHCLFCHGWEERGQESVGVLAVGDCADLGPALHLSRMAQRLAGKVTVYSDGALELSQSLAGPLKAEGFELVSTPIAKLSRQPDEHGVTLEFVDGTVRKEGFLVHKPKTELNASFAEQLSLELTQGGDISVKPPFYESTNVPGVYAVGDCGSVGKAVSQALASGLWCASGVVARLQAPAH